MFLLTLRIISCFVFCSALEKYIPLLLFHLLHTYLLRISHAPYLPFYSPSNLFPPLPTFRPSCFPLVIPLVLPVLLPTSAPALAPKLIGTCFYTHFLTHFPTHFPSYLRVTKRIRDTRSRELYLPAVLDISVL